MPTKQRIFDDLNDLRYFSLVVESEGFSAAERSSGISKSRLSARIAALEKRMGVRLLQRTTRHVSLTELGRQFHVHCQGLLAEAQAAQDVIDRVSGSPRGLVRISCPILATRVYIAPHLPQFMAKYPRVSVHVVARDRPVDLRTEPIDIALRLRQPDEMDPDLISKPLGVSRRILVASPRYLYRAARISTPADLNRVATLHYDANTATPNWHLSNALSNERAIIKHDPVLLSEDYETVLQAAMQEQGVAMLPDILCHSALAQDKLRIVLPGWEAAELVFHLAFRTGRGMLPAVRALVDFLSDRLPLIAATEPP